MVSHARPGCKAACAKAGLGRTSALREIGVRARDSFRGKVKPGAFSYGDGRTSDQDARVPGSRLPEQRPLRSFRA